MRKGKKNKNLPAAPKAPASPEAPQDSALESKKDSDYADYDKGDDLKHKRESRISQGACEEGVGGPWRLQKLTQLIGLRVCMLSIDSFTWEFPFLPPI